MWEGWAVLKINADRPLPYIAIGNSKSLKINSKVIAGGFPEGRDIQTSARGPSVKLIEGMITRIDTSAQDGCPRLTHTCQLTPVLSGGPLMNRRGELVGINTFVDSYVVGENYAIPADLLYDEVWIPYAKAKPAAP